MKNNENAKLASGWHIFKIICISIGSVFTPIMIVLVGSFYSNTMKEREIQTRYIEIASQILQQKPDESNKGIRLWAIGIFKEYSPISISPQVEKELQQQPLYKSVVASTEFSARAGFKPEATVTHGNTSTEFSMGAGFKPEATVTPGNKNPQNKNLPEQQKR